MKGEREAPEKGKKKQEILEARNSGDCTTQFVL
jgi:hypothetical protein